MLVSCTGVIRHITTLCCENTLVYLVSLEKSTWHIYFVWIGDYWLTKYKSPHLYLLQYGLNYHLFIWIKFTGRDSNIGTIIGSWVRNIFKVCYWFYRKSSSTIICSCSFLVSNKFDGHKCSWMMTKYGVSDLENETRKLNCILVMTSSSHPINMQLHHLKLPYCITSHMLELCC